MLDELVVLDQTLHIARTELLLGSRKGVVPALTATSDAVQSLALGKMPYGRTFVLIFVRFVHFVVGPDVLRIVCIVLVIDDGGVDLAHEVQQLAGILMIRDQIKCKLERPAKRGVAFGDVVAARCGGSESGDLSFGELLLMSAQELAARNETETPASLGEGEGQNDLGGEVAEIVARAKDVRLLVGGQLLPGGSGCCIVDFVVAAVRLDLIRVCIHVDLLGGIVFGDDLHALGDGIVDSIVNFGAIPAAKADAAVLGIDTNVDLGEKLAD